MRIVFFGTPGWAVPSLEGLVSAGEEVSAVVCNPDKPSGRGMKEHAPPVKEAALRLGLPVQQPPSARDPAVARWLRELSPDVAVVVAYGKILPAQLLEVPRMGFVNLHFSLLPRYRGAAPVQRAVMEGQKETGASIMVLTEGMDEGPVIAAESTSILPEETSGELGERLAISGARLLLSALPAYVSGDLTPVAQDEEAATYAAKITPEEARIDWSRPASQLHDLIRGLNPAPGAWTTLEDRVKIWRSHPAEVDPGLSPGAIALGKEELLVGTGEGALVLDEVQAAGKKRMAGADYARGLRLAPSASFG